SYTLLDTEVLDHGFGTDPQFQAGATLLRRPAHQGVIGIDWTGLPRLTSSLRVRVVGTRADLDFTDPDEWQGRRVTLPAYSTTDVTLEYALPLQGSDASLRAGVQNLWNEAYADIYNFPRPGRLLMMGVRYGVTL
ncbi:MAG TPA: hypothetical protein VK939_16070, partial [Longimicrobiales bacterium]|nr:hypothetical protein [Longimicrobiales bacterium]